MPAGKTWNCFGEFKLSDGHDVVYRNGKETFYGVIFISIKKDTKFNIYIFVAERMKQPNMLNYILSDAALSVCGSEKLWKYSRLFSIIAFHR